MAIWEISSKSIDRSFLCGEGEMFRHTTVDEAGANFVDGFGETIAECGDDRSMDRGQQKLGGYSKRARSQFLKKQIVSCAAASK